MPEDSADLSFVPTSDAMLLLPQVMKGGRVSVRVTGEGDGTLSVHVFQLKIIAVFQMENYYKKKKNAYLRLSLLQRLFSFNRLCKITGV